MIELRFFSSLGEGEREARLHGEEASHTPNFKQQLAHK